LNDVTVGKSPFAQNSIIPIFHFRLFLSIYYSNVPIFHSSS
jgi:hypothetical protein